MQEYSSPVNKDNLIHMSKFVICMRAQCQKRLLQMLLMEERMKSQEFERARRKERVELDVFVSSIAILYDRLTYEYVDLVWKH